MNLAEIHCELMCTVDQLHDSPPTTPDLFAEFLLAHCRVLLDELDELLAAAGAQPLEMAA